MKKLVVAASLLLLISAGFGQELLVNGDFEQDLSVGWERVMNGYGYDTLDRSVIYQPDPDYEARAWFYSGAGDVRLRQIVEVAGLDIDFECDAAFRHYSSSATCWSVPSVAIGYWGSGTKLGETRIYSHDSYCTWASTPTLSLIEVTDTNWTHYRLNLADELSEHLTGIDPDLIERVEVALFDTTAGG